MKTALELLSTISIASPCSADWNEMAGDDNVRYCGHCSKNVYNLSALTTQGAIELIREKEGKLCGRFFRRHDGTLLTADCPVGLHHKLRRKRRLAAVAVSLAAFFTMNGCSRFDDSSTGTTADPPAKQAKPEPKERLHLGEVHIPNQFPAMAGGICAPPQLLNKPEMPETLPIPRELESQE